MLDATPVVEKNELPRPHTTHVLIAEDDVPLAHFLRRSLQGNKYEIDLAHDGEAALQGISRSSYALLILDLNLPKIDGLEVISRVRPLAQNLSILVLTARHRLEDRISVLDAGADDCMVKPFSFQELTARCRALVRRSGKASASVLRVGDLTLNREEFRVERAGKKVDLTAKEFALLEYLMLNARRTVTRAMIMEEVWKTPYDGSTNLVDVYIKYVRDKIDSGFSSRLMRTARGVGYVISDN